LKSTFSAVMEARWTVRRLLLVVAFFALSYGAWQSFNINWSDAGGRDWVAYWSVPYHLLRGNGFFNFDALAAIQREAGYPQPDFYPVLRLWNPPPLLALLLPFGGLGVTPSALVWGALTSSLYLIAALLYNRTLAHPLPQTLLVLLAVLCLPAFAVLFYGQLPLLLVALLVFAWHAQRKGQHAAAGILLVPLLFKPHLVIISAGLLVLVALRQRAWSFFLAPAGVAALLLSTAFLLDPAWIQGWRAQGPPLGLMSMSFWDALQWATLLPSWSQFTGVFLLGGWALWRYRNVRTVTPRGFAEASLLSLLAAPYGYTFDVVMLLPAVIYMGSRFAQRGMVLALVPLALFNLWLVADSWVLARYFSYLVLVVASWYLCTRRSSEKGQAATSMVAERVA
jgi:hypothetical protein